MFRFNPARRRWPQALKASITICLPVLATTLMGRPELGLLASLGTFAVLYGADTPGRFRIRLLSAMAAAFVVCAALGVLAAAIPVVLLIVLVGVAAVGAAVCVTLKIGPPGSYFLVLAAGIASFMTSHGGVPGGLIIGMTVIGGALAVVIGMADLAFDPHRPEREAVQAAERAVADFEAAADPPTIRAAHAGASTALHAAWTSFRDGVGERPVDDRNSELYDRIGMVQTRYTRRAAELTGQIVGAEPNPWGNPEGEPPEKPGLDPEFEPEQLLESSLGRPEATYLIGQVLRWPSEVTLVIVRVAVAAAISGTLSLILGFTHAYWGVAFAALVLHQGGTRAAQTVRGLQRLVGTLGGLGLYVLVAWWNPQALWLVAVLFALQFAIEMTIVRNYAAAVVFITPLSLTISYAGTGVGDPGTLAMERAVDTLLSVAIALGTLWLVGRGTSVLLVRAHGRRTILATEQVMRDLADAQYSSSVARENRRHLYYELLELERCLGQAMADEPKRVAPYRDMVEATTTLGYLVLGACWHPQVRKAREAFGQAAGPLQLIKAHKITRRRQPEEIRAEVLAVQQVITEWR